MKKNSYLLELAKKWHSSSKIKSIPGVELDDVYQEIYLLWLELDKPGQFDESKLCTYYFAIARKLGYWQGCSRFSDADEEKMCDEGESSSDCESHLEAAQSPSSFDFESKSESVYIRHAAEIDLIDDELDRLHHLKSSALGELLGISSQHSRLVRSRYESAIVQRCKDKINRVAKRQKANPGA